MSGSIEERFERYCKPIVEALSHADRCQPAQWYLQGLMLPGERKSVEPMAARVYPHNVRSAHQAMHHLVAEGHWSDEAVLAAVAREVLPALLNKDERGWWIIDDTSHVKKGRHSVGVARQYCGRLGKTENCQVAVSLSLANVHGSLPLAYRLYLPKEWVEDGPRCRKAGVPQGIGFRTKGEMARAHIEAALERGIPRGVVLADAAYGDEAGFRDSLAGQALPYVLGVRAGTRVWWGKHQPLPSPPYARARPRTRFKRDAGHQPIAVLELVQALPGKRWRQVTWRSGSSGPLSSRFARVREPHGEPDHAGTRHRCRDHGRDATAGGDAVRAGGGDAGAVGEQWGSVVTDR